MGVKSEGDTAFVEGCCGCFMLLIGAVVLLLFVVIRLLVV